MVVVGSVKEEEIQNNGGRSDTALILGHGMEEQSPMKYIYYLCGVGLHVAAVSGQWFRSVGLQLV